MVFGPKPPPDANFTKIELGHKSSLVLHLLIFGLLRELTPFHVNYARIIMEILISNKMFVEK